MAFLDNNSTLSRKPTADSDGNQYSNGSMSNPDNSSWMAPSMGNDSTLNQQNNQNGSGFNWLSGSSNTGISGGVAGVDQARQENQQSQQIIPTNGTAIDSVSNGWMMPSSSAPSNSNIYLGQLKQTDPGYTGVFGEGVSQGANNQIQAPVYQTPNQSPNQGSVGQYMPSGYDSGKFNDPNKHDPKYDVGRILSKYPPGPAGLQQAMNELGPLGYRQTGKDTISGPGGIIDVGRAFSTGDPNQMRWDWMPQDGGGNMNGQPIFGAPSNNMMNQPQYAGQLRAPRTDVLGRPLPGNAQNQPQAPVSFNQAPSPGYMPPSGNTGVSGNINNPQMTFGGYQNPNQGPPQLQFGAPSQDMVNILSQMQAGTYRPPNYGMPQ